MRRSLLAIAILLLNAHACLAQLSTMGTTAMGLPSTPAAIVTSPLYGPSPFSATTQPGAPATILAPVPLASDPATPGTVISCSTPTGQITPGTPTATVISTTPYTSPGGTTIGAMPSVSTAPPTSTLPPIAIPPLTFSQQPETSAATVFPGSIIPVPQPVASPLPLPSTTPAPVPALSTGSGTVYTYVPGTTATMMSSTTMMPSTTLGTIASPVLGSTTGTVSAASPLGSSSTIACSFTPGGPPTNGAALPLSTPEIPSSPPPGTIQPDITQLVTTSIDPTMTVMPTPNTSACAESMTMNLSAPGTMPSANATGAAATPGVSPASPSGC